MALARVERPAYSHLYDFLEALFIARAEIRSELRNEAPLVEGSLAKTKWENGFPLINRWDFQIDTAAADNLLEKIGNFLPTENRQLSLAYESLKRSLAANTEHGRELWNCFLQHEMEPWEEWLDINSEADTASILFLARSAIRPSIEASAQSLLQTHGLPTTWHRGYCPVCGSLPSLLYLEAEGARKAFCSWCSTRWDLHRLQCPYCDNRYHESLGYIGVEEQPQNRITYCNLCKFYFKQIDTRELAYAPYLPLEEWTTLHLDIIARKEGWLQPPSPAPAVYAK